MAGIKITPISKRFKSEVTKSFNLIKTINKIKLPLKQKYVFLIVELSFLKIYLAWERFLEDSFVKYMLGGVTSHGYKVKSYVTPKNFIHAQQIINEGKNYSKWDYDETIKKAHLFFMNSGPYKEALQPIYNYLREMSDIRNSVVHESRHSIERFKSIVRSKIKYAPQNITPGEFLLMREPKTKKSFFEYYTNFLLDASNKIVP